MISFWITHIDLGLNKKSRSSCQTQTEGLWNSLAHPDQSIRLSMDEYGGQIHRLIFVH